MARRKAIPTDNGEQPILPLHLTQFRGSGAAEFRDYNKARRQWFLERGINPGDWNTTRAIDQASRRAHGLPDNSALARARLRITDPDLLHQQRLTTE